MDSASPTSEGIRSKLEVLFRTRESLSSSGRFSSQPGQVLERALDKTISLRQAELNSKPLTPQSARNISVIVRNSTPVPLEDLEGHSNCSSVFFAKPCNSHVNPHATSFAPEDKSLPLKTLLRDLSNPSNFEESLNSSIEQIHPLEPKTPWSPCKSVSPHKSAEPLSSLLTSPETRPLLAPFITDASTGESEPDVDTEGKAMEEALGDCTAKLAHFNSLLKRYTPKETNKAAVNRLGNEWITNLEKSWSELISSIEILISKHGTALGSEAVKRWRNSVTQCETDLEITQNALCDELANLQLSSSSSLPASRNSSLNTAANTITSSDKVKEALAYIDVDYDIITSEGDQLKEEFTEFEWDSATDSEIEIALKKVDDWNKRYEKLLNKKYDIQRRVKIHDLDDTKLKAATTYVNTLGAELEVKAAEIKFEDEERCLYSLNRTKTSTVRLPAFSGQDDEDFSIFERDIKKGFVTNRIKKDDQVKKLRECLKGHAKRIIPRTMDDIDEAFKILRELYGDPSRVMNARKAKIMSMGKFPYSRNNTPRFLEDQVQYLLQLELCLQEMFEIGKLSTSMDRAAFSPDLIGIVTELFPTDIQDDLALCSDADSKVELNLILDHIKSLRSTKQKVLKSKACSSFTLTSSNDGRKNRHDRGSGRGHKEGEFIPTSAVSYNPARRDEKCRICVTLDAQGDTRDLYDEHWHSVASGCPRFASMSRSKKIEMADKAKLCHSCLDEKFIKTRPNQTHADCPVKNKKFFYTCNFKDCKKHFWLCTAHDKFNEQKLKKSTNYWNERGKTFANIAMNGALGHLGKKKTKKMVDKGGKIHKQSMQDFEQKEDDNCDLKKATEKLKAVAGGAEIIDVPEGDPLFLFSYAQGKTRPVNIFYDKGCSHIVFKHGVPGSELDGIMTKKGPLSLNAVGDTSIKCRDEWVCLLNKSNGSKQVVQGVSVDRITSTFPQINVNAAVNEVKNDDPENQELQSLKVPQFVGGEPDVLLGILYEKCHPVKVHTLPSGLFIAKLQLASHDVEFNGVIGGPHATFRALAEQTGGANNLMVHFVDGLQKFNELGAPKLHAPLMSNEDIHFAKEMNKAEIFDVTGCLVDDEEFDEICDDEDLDSVSGEDVRIHCSTCGDFGVEDLIGDVDHVKDVIESVDAYPSLVATSTVDTDDKLRELKILAKLQELGISLDYRCPKCRSCTSCRNAPNTERVSLREELEEQAIKDSVKIDFENKKIECTLPLRGKEESFLSSNRDVALKVLDSQCKKLKNDPEAKEIIIKSFQKLFDGNFARKFEDLSEYHQNLILQKPVQHYLPWRCVYKDSISTPCRCVMDASSKTPLLPNGQGGRCLNDLCMKGTVRTLDLLNMLLRFVLGPAACAGDLKQFYPSISLTENQWNLQRVLWRENMDMNTDIVELIIVVLIYGVRSVSALSEQAVIMLAEHIRHKNPRLAALLLLSRFVDDLADSDKNTKQISDLTKQADELFESVSMKCKGWSISLSPPHPDCTNDGISVDVGGLVWYPEIDCISVKIPPIHFGKKSRGKLSVGTEIFDGSFADLETFCSKRFTRRVVVSKLYSVFDMFGKLTPVTAAMKVDMSEAIKETKDWDSEVSLDIHNRMVKNLWRLHKLKSMKFTRAKVPVDAADLKLSLYGTVDAANKLKIVAIYARFRRKNGRYSCQLLIGRSLLSRDGTIAQEELESMTIGSNLLWICRRALTDWLDSYHLFGDSVIAICWVISEKKRLSIFHRNRCNQIRMNTPVEMISHVKTDYNPSDVGTRPDRLEDDDVGPDSVWENGFKWMNDSLEKAVSDGIITPSSELTLKKEDESEYNKGVVLERMPEILVRGHSAFVSERSSRMAERALFSDYILSPLKFSFSKVVRVTAHLFRMFKRRNNVSKTYPKQNFKMFATFFGSEEGSKYICDPKEVLACSAAEGDDMKTNFKLNDEDLSDALSYWFLKGTNEVKKFYKKEFIDKLAIEKNDILYNRSRILDGQRLVVTGEFKAEFFDAFGQLNLMTPVLDRDSPISLSIALYVHEVLGLHAGYETCYRLSLSICHIIQGASLFRQIGEQCSKCAMLRRKYLDVCMGPVSQHQLTIAPAFYAAFVDLDGPYSVTVPGFEKQTRARHVISAKVWIMTFACPMTKACNLQVIEAKSTDVILEGFTRFACENGMSKYFLIDQETSFLKAVKNAEIDLVGLDARAFKEYGVYVKIAPVAGHNFSGLVERKIRSVQETFEKIGLKKQTMHATGLQTLCKLVESHLNNTPLGFSYGRSANNSPILKLVTPNLMKIGRINSRCVDGPFRLPTGPKDLMINVEKLYDAFYKIWNVAVLPRMIPQPKWFRSSKELKVEDVVYFQKSEGDLTSKWTVGQVHSVERSSDGVVRRAVIRYHNHGENNCRYTDRCVRSLVRLFDIEDNYWVRDISEYEALLDALKKEDARGEKVKPIKLVKQPHGDYKIKGNAASMSKCNCCCEGHCKLSKNKHVGSSKIAANLTKMMVNAEVEEHEFPNIYVKEMSDDHTGDDSVGNHSSLDAKDPLYSMLTSLETNFSLES